jgi:hypothetical protein
MSLVDEISASIADAMRQRDRTRLAALRMLKAALTNRAIERGRELDETESRQVVSSQIKQRRDSIEQFTKGSRPDLAKQEAAEIEVLEAYLPPAIEPDVLDDIIREAIAESRAQSPKDVGRVMKAVMSRLAGQNVDGKTVSDLVRKTLGA